MCQTRDQTKDELIISLLLSIKPKYHGTYITFYAFGGTTCHTNLSTT